MALNLSSSRELFHDLKRHLGHKIKCVSYGDDANIAIECHTCNEILIDADNPKDWVIRHTGSDKTNPW